MNKHQRTKSRRIKRYIRIVKRWFNIDVSYKEAKRRFKCYDLLPEGRIFSAHAGPTGYSGPIYIIDDRPIDDPPALWPKENPYFATRHISIDFK